MDSDGDRFDQCAEFDRHGVVQGDHVPRWYRDVLGERRDDVGCDTDDVLVGAMLLAADELGRLPGRNHHRVEGHDVADREAVLLRFGAAFGDDTYGLVPHDLAGHPPTVLSGEPVDVGAANARRHDLEQDLVPLGDGLLLVMDGHLPEVVQYECLHVISSHAVGRTGRYQAEPRCGFAVIETRMFLGDRLRGRVGEVIDAQGVRNTEDIRHEASRQIFAVPRRVNPLLTNTFSDGRRWRAGVSE